METIQLTQAEREQLHCWVRRQMYSAAQARRARLILLIDAGERFNVIRSKLDCDTNFIARWKSRFLADRLAGCVLAMWDVCLVRIANAKSRAFLNGRFRKSPPTVRRTGASENWRRNLGMSRI